MAPADPAIPLSPAVVPREYALAACPVTEGNGVELLPGGSEAYPAMLRMIEAARTEVLLETYIFADDSTGRRFWDALVTAAARGCVVRVMGDAVGSSAIPSHWIEELEMLGGQWLPYRPVAPWRRRWGVWRRDHRKVLVIDEEVGFVGGLNIADEYDQGTPAGRSWRDLHLRISGPAVASLAQLFVRTWNAECPHARRMQWHRPTIEHRAGGVAISIVGNRETRHRSLIRHAFLYATRRARRTILLANPYFIPDRAVFLNLAHAAGRGVDVRLVVPARSDIRLIDLAARWAFPRLLRAGVRIAEWPGMMHAKAATVDGSWSTVGSYNFDRRSLRFNLEVTANVYDRGLGGIMEARLLDDFARAREITVEELDARPFVDRLLSSIAYRLRSFL